jgi:hypothetical protein
VGILFLAALSGRADDTEALKQKQLDAVQKALLEIKALNGGQPAPTGAIAMAAKPSGVVPIVVQDAAAAMNYSLMFAGFVLLASLAGLWLNRRFAAQRRKNLCVRLATATTALPETSNSRAAAVAAYFRKKVAEGSASGTGSDAAGQ